MNTDPKGYTVNTNNESGPDYIARVARDSSLMGQRGRIAWSSLVGLVTPADLRAAVAAGLVTTEKVASHGRAALHIIARP